MTRKHSLDYFEFARMCFIHEDLSFHTPFPILQSMLSLVAVVPPAKSDSLFEGFSGKHNLISTKTVSLTIQPILQSMLKVVTVLHL